MAEPVKCRVKDSHVFPCDALYRQSEAGNPRLGKRGIFIWQLYSFASDKSRRSFIGCVSTETPKGRVFNFCPFCGVQIDGPALQAKKEVQ